MNSFPFDQSNIYAELSLKGPDEFPNKFADFFSDNPVWPGSTMLQFSRLYL